MRKFLTFITFVFCLNNLSAQSNFIHQDTIFGRTANCASGVPVCIDSVAYDSVNSFRYFVDGQPFNGSVGVTLQGLRLSVPSGVHKLVVEEILTGQRDTVVVVAACMLSDTVRREVVTQSSNYYCFDTSRLQGRAGTLFNLCKNNSPEYLFDAPSGGCIRYLGRRIGVDTACLMMCDNLGNCATTTLIVTTKYTFERGTRVYDTISVGSSRVLKNIAAPIGNITRMTNMGQAPPGLSASFDINQASKTLTLSGLAVGQDTAYIQVCSQFGYCDTTYLYITTVAPQQIMVIDTAKIYRLVARSSQKALSIRNASSSLAADAVQADTTGGLNQKWTIKNADIDAFSLSVQHTNMNLDTRWGTKRSGSRLMQWSKNASLTQKWLFIPIGNGYFKIINKASGRALSINGGTSANINNAYLVQLNYEGSTSQQWRIEALP
jgi:Ricin-type beta-trefoil lectin domain-like